MALEHFISVMEINLQEDLNMIKYMGRAPILKLKDKL